MNPSIPTPRSSTARNNGHLYLFAEAQEMERQLAYARETLEEIQNCLESASGDPLNIPDWINEAIEKMKPGQEKQL